MFNIRLYLSGLILVSKMIKRINLKKLNNNIYVNKPILNVSIIIPTLNEEAFIENTLKSIYNQNVIQKYPDLFELIVIDSNSTDQTIEITKQYTNKIILCENGKLNARHIATEYANGEIIVAIDADTYYPPNWLNEMLKYYYNENVVAVCGGRYFIKSNDILYGTVYDIYTSLLRPLHKRICGGNSSYLKSAYYNIGGFNLNINQQNIKEMINEEEINFYKKLSKLGTIINTSSLSVLTSDRHLIRDTNKCVTNSNYCDDVISGRRF